MLLQFLLGGLYGFDVAPTISLAPLEFEGLNEFSSETRLDLAKLSVTLDPARFGIIL